MTTIEDSQQHDSEIKDLATAEDTTSTGESTPLMENNGHRTLTRMQQKFRCRWRYQRCCLSSKAVILILVWNLILVAGLESFLDPNYFKLNIFVPFDDPSGIIFVSGITYSIFAFLFLFYPLAGCLADICWGRYKAVVISLCAIWGSLVAMVVFGGVATLGFIPLMIKPPDAVYPSGTVQIITLAVVCVVFGLPTFIAVLLLLCGIVSFSANVIQFGMDQLHDAPTEDSILYIHWYVWTSYAGLLPMKLGFTIGNMSTGLSFSLCSISLPLVFLGVTLCIQQYKRHWFLTDSGSRNPYKLVYKVLKFAKDHTYPIRRSAFTYCEDELPSRLDLGKEKYGGPFTTEQVEDVKAFLGILCVLLTLGPIMMLDFSMVTILSEFASHLDIKVFKSVCIEEPGFKVDSFTLLLITLLIPLYLCLLRPFILDYIPGVLKRIGLGMIFILLSTLCTSALDAYGHLHANVTTCFLSGSSYDYFSQCIDYPTLNINSYYLLIQHSLNAVGYMLLYIAIYEFICAQSPHAMKGLMIGTLFAIKGVFQLLGVVIIYVPVAFGWPLNIVRTFPSCGFVYYLINAIIALIGIVAYTCVARQYQYRQRDEPDNIYRYAEEYYANAQDEPNYDYDDYDNLDVHTVNN